MLAHSTKTFPVFKRYYSKTNQFNNSKQIRKLFFNYFIEQNGHSFVKSSPVIPYCDPSLLFVNAGMNQFKNIFLGLRTPPFSKVANSQKCIRVGGKHNDLDVVGTDGYHHTFFEMLGNWSFGAYFKREACELAWALLTGPYKLNPSNLYVTYFEGNASLGLEADLETLDIWRTIGVKEDHIIPFGIKDNFWEMGLTGPCGPCTEIHVDHTGSNLNRSSDVNKGFSNLTELWNIVFIQFNRDKNGLINKLSQKFVDTGMGFERLTALLQGKNSNYETDLFLPIFNTIHMANKHIPKYCGKYGIDDINGLDTAYRIIADHGRMATICLSDGMIPEENYKLRKIIRKSMILRERFFQKQDKFLHDISESVIDILGETYPELIKNTQQIQNILSYEEDVLKSLRANTPPEWMNILIKNPELESTIDAAEVSNFVLGYKEVLKLQHNGHKLDNIPAKLAFKLYDTYGLDKNKIIEMSKLFNLPVDWHGFDEEIKTIRNKTKFSHSFPSEQNLLLNLKTILQRQNILPTNDSYKYNYSVDNESYQFYDVNANVKCIVEHGKSLVMKSNEKNCSIIFDNTCFYCEAGGQESDKGLINFEDGKVFQVESVQNCEGYIIHSGSFLTPNAVVSAKEKAIMKIDRIHRMSNMKNHSSTHILNAAIKKVLPTSTICQKSSRVTAKDLKFDIFVFGKLLTSDYIDNVEEIVRDVIDRNIIVNTHVINENDLLVNDVVLLPGEVYPANGIRLVEIVNSDFQSREACCGTHVKNTSHILDFCVISFKQNGRASYSLKAVTGEKAIQVKEKGNEIEKFVNNLYHELELNKHKTEETKRHLKNLSKILNDTENIIPYNVHMKCINVLNNLKNTFKQTDRQNLRELMEMEIKSAVEEVNISEKPWVVHYLRSSSIVPGVSLQKATRCCRNLPIVVLAYSDGTVKARCCVPKNYVTDDFNAEKWMKLTIGTIFSGNVSAPKGQDPLYVCNMKESKVSKDQWDVLLQVAMDSANKYAENHLNKVHKFRSNM